MQEEKEAKPEPENCCCMTEEAPTSKFKYTVVEGGILYFKRFLKATRSFFDVQPRAYKPRALNSPTAVASKWLSERKSLEEMNTW